MGSIGPMTVITMSRTEIDRMGVLHDLADCRIKIAEASTLMGLGRRQVFRLAKGYGKQSGRIEGRDGVRMMPTFPRSPLSFRTAGFPQYGWKAGFPSGAFLGDQRLKPAPGMRRPTSSLHPPFVRLVVSTV